MIYEIAELRIDVKNKYQFTDRFCKDWKSVDEISPADFSVQADETLIEEEKLKSPNFSDGYLENICLFREIANKLPFYDRFLVHCCVVEYLGEGYAFCGLSGAGKSTHSSLWLKYVEGSKILNGDKPIIAVQSDGLYAYGTPWLGKERLGYNGKSKLKALCFIEKSKENHIERLSKTDLTTRLFSQLYVPSDSVAAEKTLEFADKLTEIPAYVLYCDITEEAVKTSFEMLTGEKYEN